MITVTEKPATAELKFKQGDIVQHRSMREWVYLLGQKGVDDKFSYVILRASAAHTLSRVVPEIASHGCDFPSREYQLFEGTITLENVK